MATSAQDKQISYPEQKLSHLKSLISLLSIHYYKIITVQNIFCYCIFLNLYD